MELWAVVDEAAAGWQAAVETGGAFEGQLGYLLRGLGFWGQLALVWATSSRLLLKPFGAERLFWGERAWVQFSTHFFVGLHACVVLFTWYVLDEPTRLLDWLDGRSPFGGSADAGVRQLGGFLAAGVTLYGALLIAAKLASLATNWWAGRYGPAVPKPLWWRYLRSRWGFIPGILGYVASMLFVYGLYCVDERGLAGPEKGERVTLRTWFFERADAASGRKLSADLNEQALADGEVRAAEQENYELDDARVGPRRNTRFALHGVATMLVAVSGALLGVYFLMLRFGRWRSPRYVVAGPTVLVCSVLSLATLVYGFAVFHWVSPLTVILLGGGGLLALNSPVLWRYRCRFPGLDYSREARFRLADYDPDAGGLLKDETVLLAHIDRLRKECGVEKPRLVLLAVSGGGIRAAVWVPVVLEGLQALDPRVFEHVRLITGASGGMVGAGLFVAARGMAARGPKSPTGLEPVAAGRRGAVPAGRGADDGAARLGRQPGDAAVARQGLGPREGTGAAVGAGRRRAVPGPQPVPADLRRPGGGGGSGEAAVARLPRRWRSRTRGASW